MPASFAARWVVSTLVLGAISGYTAYRKGYNYSWWFFACGCIGLLVAAFLPNTKGPHVPKEKKKKLRRLGNVIGICLTGLNVASCVIFYIRALGTIGK